MAAKAEPYQRTPRDEWLFAADALRLTLAERKAMLALHAHMAEDSLEAFAGNIRMATMAGCDVRTITRGLSLLVRRGVISIEVKGGGAGNLTLYRGAIPSEKTGAEHGSGKHPSNSATAAVHSDGDRKGRVPVSEPSSNKESKAWTEKTGAQTGAETGAASRARVLGKGKVELSTPRFARDGPAASPSAGRPPEEKLRDFVWRFAKAFPAKRRFFDGVAVLNEWLDAGTTTRAELVARLDAWQPWFADLHQMNGHSSGYTVRGWLESGNFRLDPGDVHDWSPSDDDDDSGEPDLWSR